MVRKTSLISRNEGDGNETSKLTLKIIFQVCLLIWGTGDKNLVALNFNMRKSLLRIYNVPSIMI